MADAVSIVNQALQQVGARAQITSLSEGSVAANAANLLYTTQFQALARSAHWNCLRCQTDLDLLRAAPGTYANQNGTTLEHPPYPWLFEYAWPDDCLAGRFVLPIYAEETDESVPFTTGSQAISPWDQFPIAGLPFVPASDTDPDDHDTRIKVILTAAPRAKLVYTGDVTDPDLWDPSFTNAFINLLAAWLVNPLNMDKSLLQQRVAVAKDLVWSARMSDGNEGMTPQDHFPDWLLARATGGGPLFGNWGGANNLGYCAPWASLALPGGVTF